jgi:hypothetical protein
MATAALGQLPPPLQIRKYTAAPAWCRKFAGLLPASNFSSLRICNQSIIYKNLLQYILQMDYCRCLPV